MEKSHIINNFEQLTVCNKYAVVLDIEHSCTEDGSIPPQDRETIEIGAVLIDCKTLEVVSEYQSFVKPIIHPVISQFCADLTGIQQAELDNSAIFKEVFSDFIRWLPSEEDWLFVSWGSYDLVQLNLDCSLHGLNTFEPLNILNLKKAFKQFSNLRKPVGLKKALEISIGAFSGSHHRALDDARNAAKILTHLLYTVDQNKTTGEQNSLIQRPNPFKDASIENPGVDRASSRARSYAKLKNIDE